MIAISARSNLNDLTRSLDAFARKQVPFAMAQAVNATAARVQAEEIENIKQTFKSPTPFTQKSIGLRKANKANPVATVFVKDIAAKYLLPYETGGAHMLNSKALLNPKGVSLNGYGQLSRGMLAKLKARPDVFIGKVKTKDGQEIDGVWQRPFIRKDQKIRGKSKVPRGANTTGKLKLLIRFGDALPVTKQLNYGKNARAIVGKYLARDFDAALKAAMATAK
jgi:hypothetical protein